ncbi:nucleotidyltransferase domain-containing protein [Cellulomonas sp. S1-8]|uniref:nucleotidyltransferase domain-containing protein n=1 Tax=Cellulomonas sp. S1-8 TaxID=2904790 RepID=UPI0022448025|nr:nucleotidyltransferase domain-containing protein [Cellulomonas sp. S1-8]UZN02188.1 nucleotidyltransferase domain-containing protein [Cellulomonas sp. S1-8]
MEGPVLYRLYRVMGPQTVGEIHKRAGVGSLSGVRGAIDRLVAQGLAVSHPVGKVVGFTLNRDHVAYPAVKALFEAYDPYREFSRRLHDLVAGHVGDVPDLVVAVFGSVARRSATVTSDVDIIVMTPDDPPWDDDRALALSTGLAWEVRRWTGNEPQIVEMSRRQLLSAARERDPLVESLRADADTVVGEDLRQLLDREVPR